MCAIHVARRKAPKGDEPERPLNWTGGLHCSCIQSIHISLPFRSASPLPPLLSFLLCHVASHSCHTSSLFLTIFSSSSLSSPRHRRRHQAASSQSNPLLVLRILRILLFLFQKLSVQEYMISFPRSFQPIFLLLLLIPVSDSPPPIPRSEH